MDAATTVDASERMYTIRRFRSNDELGFQRLFEQVFGCPVSEAWFDWKYRCNPYFEGIPIFVAETDGELVGARPFFTLPIRVGSKLLTGFQPSDAMVRSDHRRQGLFTRMTERALNWLDDLDEYDPFCFNFPNNNSKPGDLKLGWREVGRIPQWYRIENAGALLNGGDTLQGRLATFATNEFLAGIDTLADSGSENILIERRTELPVSDLVSLYEDCVPEQFHACRSPSFYEWRFESPRWDYRTYLARQSNDEEPVAGAVVGTGLDEGVSVAQITDMVPLTARKKNVGAYQRLLAQIIQEVAVDLITAPVNRSLPPDVFSEFGFYRDDRFPLSVLSNATTLVARPTASRPWIVNNKNIAAIDNWCLSFMEQDTR